MVIPGKTFLPGPEEVAEPEASPDPSADPRVASVPLPEGFPGLAGSASTPLLAVAGGPAETEVAPFDPGSVPDLQDSNPERWQSCHAPHRGEQKALAQQSPASELARENSAGLVPLPVRENSPLEGPLSNVARDQAALEVSAKVPKTWSPEREQYQKQ